MIICNKSIIAIPAGLKCRTHESSVLFLSVFTSHANGDKHVTVREKDWYRKRRIVRFTLLDFKSEYYNER